MYLIGQKLFDVVLRIARSRSVEQMFTLLLYARIPTAAGLQDCARFVSRSVSVDTRLLAGDERGPRCSTMNQTVW